MSGANGWHPSPVQREIRALETAKRATREARARERQRVQLIVNLTDANYECAHNCLPLDRNKPPECNCWTTGAALALAARRQEP